MNRKLNSVALILLTSLVLSCTAASHVGRPSPTEPVEAAPLHGSSNPLCPSVAALENRVPHRDRISFEDRTPEIVQRAEVLIAKNKREGAVLDQRWYGFKRLGKYQHLILGAAHVIVLGGLESDVREHLSAHYESIEPVEADQDPGEIRLYQAMRKDGTWDFIVIAHNGREVMLKTVIRLLYMREFVDEATRRQYAARLKSFPDSVQVLMSSYTARQEFADFFRRHGINDPDVVLIGFMNDVNAILKESEVGNGTLFSDESLRLTCYRTRDGKEILAVSINGNRIFGSRAGELVQALLDRIRDRPPALVFLGSAGAIEEPDLVWKIVTPTTVRSGDTFVQTDNRGELIQIVPNKALDSRHARTAHASVESVVVETTEWAKRARKLGIDTADQEFLHIIEAINGSRYARTLPIYAGVLVTDNISAKAGTGLTLEQAEETISEAVDVRREFLSEMLRRAGVLDAGTPASLNTPRPTTKPVAQTQ